MLFHHFQGSQFWVNFLLGDCRWRNNNGGIAFRDVTDSNLHLLNGNWMRNRGASVIADKIKGKTNILIENNSFRQNMFHSNTTLNSVIELGMNENDKGLHFTFSILLELFSSIKTIRARCELHSGLKLSIGASINATNNYWGTANQEEVISRICDNKRDKSLIPVIATPFLSVEFKKLPLIVTERPGNPSFLKAFSTSLIIGKDEVAVFHEGSALHFKPNHGIIVFGVLHLLGQQNHPILLKSSGHAPWLGIILSQNGIIHASHCILENAKVGLNISSSNISIQNMRIIRPIFTGILITTAYNGTFDMGESVILQSRRNGIRILKRQINDTLVIRNVQIIDCAEAGIDFVDPAGKIILQNIVLENSGSFGIIIVQREQNGLDSIVLNNLTVQKQERGSGGILLNLKSYYSLCLNTSNFASNMLPSVIIVSKCPLSGKKRKVPTIFIERNHFLKNDNLVMRITLEGCEVTKIRRNTFIRNNGNGRKGTLAIYVSLTPM
ncbi:hypothetical protein WUBG_09961, partial [Wuchereria bancrofti]